MFFVGHKHAVTNIQQIFSPVMGGFVCLNYCRYENLPGEAHSWPKQAGTYKLSKPDSNQHSIIWNHLQTWTVEEKILRTGKGSC